MAAPANNRKQFPVSRAAAPRMDSARHALAPVYYYASRDVIATPPPSRRAPRKRDSPNERPLRLSLSLSHRLAKTDLARICSLQIHQAGARQSRDMSRLSHLRFPAVRPVKYRRGNEERGPEKPDDENSTVTPISTSSSPDRAFFSKLRTIARALFFPHAPYIDN